MANNTQVRNLLSELKPTTTGVLNADGKPVYVQNKTVAIPADSSVNLHELIKPAHNTERVVLQIDGDIRVRFDNGEPTKTFGAVMGKYDYPDICMDMLKAMRAISAGEAAVNVFVAEFSY